MSRITPAGPPDHAPDVDDATALASDGRSTRWDDHRATRRAELVHAARRAVHRMGPDVSMDEIATTAGTSKSIVYRYFADKTGLQVAVGEAVIAQMHTALDEAARAATTPRDALRSMVDIYLEMVESSPNVYSFVTRPVTEDASAPLGHFLEAVATLIAEPFARVLTAGTREPALADVWAAGAVGFVRGAGDWWLTHRSDADAPTREELTERVAAWLWAGPVGSLARTRTTPSSTSADQPTDVPTTDVPTVIDPTVIDPTLNDEEPA